MSLRARCSAAAVSVAGAGGDFHWERSCVNPLARREASALRGAKAEGSPPPWPLGGGPSPFSGHFPGQTRDGDGVGRVGSVSRPGGGRCDHLIWQKSKLKPREGQPENDGHSLAGPQMLLPGTQGPPTRRRTQKGDGRNPGGLCPSASLWGTFYSSMPVQARTRPTRGSSHSTDAGLLAFHRDLLAALKALPAEGLAPSKCFYTEIRAHSPTTVQLNLLP